MMNRIPKLGCVVIAVMSVGAVAQNRPLGAIPERQQAAVDAFAAEFPDVRLHVEKQRIARVYGAPFAFDDTPQQAAANFLHSYSGMFGVSAEELVPLGVREIAGGKFSVVTYMQHFDGIPVHAARVTVLTRADLGNGVVLVSPNLVDLTDAQLEPVAITGERTISLTEKSYPDYQFTDPELVVFIDRREEMPAPMFAWRFVGESTDVSAPAKYEFMIDAASDDAEVVHLKSLIYFEDVSGTVTGMATPGDLPDRADNLPVAMFIPAMRVRMVGGNTGQTDNAGDYAISNGGVSDVTVQASVGGSGGTQAGEWVTVDNFAGGELTESQVVTPPGPADFLFNASPAEFNTAQVNGFIHTTLVRQFVLGIDASYPFFIDQMLCVVNRNDGFCPGNAWYNGTSINFCRVSGSSPNTAYASVVYHEYGHHIVDSGHPFATGDYHEGLSDVTTSLLMDTPCLGRGFLGGNGCLRSANNSVNYPCSGASHTCGQVISGAFWGLRNELVFTEPSDYLDIARSLYLASILLQPSGITPAITIDVLTLDDDNGDLSDGTPHYAEICAGFGAKNLNCPPPLSFEYPDGRPSSVLPNQDTTFGVNVVSQGGTPISGSGRFFYSLDDGVRSAER